MMKTETYTILRDILGKTNDGDCLSPEDLRLVEYCANNPLTEKSEAAIYRLHQNVISGYCKPWYHGIKNMTRDHEGFIYWKGIRVEHYTFDAYSKADRAARDLEKTCKALEKQGMTPTASSVLEGVESFRTAKPQNNPKMHRVDAKR